MISLPMFQDMENDLKDLSFLSSNNIELAGNMDVLETMQMALEVRVLVPYHWYLSAGASKMYKGINKGKPQICKR